MLCHTYDKNLDKAYQLLKILSLPHAAHYALCIKFAQNLASDWERLYSLLTQESACFIS